MDRKILKVLSYYSIENQVLHIYVLPLRLSTYSIFWKMHTTRYLRTATILNNVIGKRDPATATSWL